MADSYKDISKEEIELRTAFAKMRSLEISVAKDELALEEKKRNICRIDAALDAFDEFLSDFITMLTSLPDKVQSTIQTTTPEQYKEIQDYIDDQLQRLSKKRLYLAIDSTSDEQARATAVKNESIQKNAKIKKKK